MELSTMKKQVKIMDHVDHSKLKKAGNNIYWLNPCPVCGHDDHFTIYPEENTFHSFAKCCEGKSIIDYFMVVDRIDQPAAIDKLRLLTGNKLDDNHQKKEDKKVVAMPVKQEKLIDPAVTVEIIKLKSEGGDDTTGYYSSRGLSDALLKKYELGYLPKGSMRYGQSFKYMLPVSKNFMIFRSDNDDDRYRNLGSPEIFNICYLDNPSLFGKKIFITEGLFDALSFEEVGMAAMALNSTANADTFIKKVESKKKELMDKVFVIAQDNDDAGRASSEKLKKALDKMGLKYIEYQITGYKDANNFLIENRDLFIKEIVELHLSGSTYEFLEDEFELNQIQRLQEESINTGLYGLDKTLGGGLYPGLHTLGSISSLGKTALALLWADNIAAAGQNVLFFSLEMGKYEMVCRSLSRAMFENDGEDSTITTGDILKGRYRGEAVEKYPGYHEAISAYREKVAKNITILEGNFDVDVNVIRQQIKEHSYKTGKKPVVFIDYLQVIKPIDPRQSEKQHIDQVVLELKRISRDFNIPVVAVSSFNRANYNTQVTFESFKESGAVEYTSDTVMGLQLRGIGKDVDVNELKIKEPRPLQLLVLKNRRGKAFEKIDIDYYPKVNYFTEV